MKKYIKILFLLCVVYWTTNNAFAVHIDTIIRVDQEHKSISAPDAILYQWYVGGEKIIGATDKNLKIEETGTYKVKLVNMHGDTTEIESSFLVTAAGAIIKIYIIGDSTVSSYNAAAYPQAGWGQVLPAFFNTANLTFSNKAIGGRSSRSFFEEGRWTPIKDVLNPGDYVFIQWGHNDRDNSNASRYTSVADYKRFLTMYCTDTKAKGAIPVLISPMVMNAWTGTTMRNVFTENGNNYRGAMLEVATALNVAFVDLNMKSWNLYKTYGAAYNQRFIYKGFVAGEYPNYPAGITDGTHFQEMGAISNARMIVEGIRELSTRADMANLISNIKPQYQIAVAVNPVGSDQLTTKTSTYPQGLTITLKTITKTTSTFQKWNNAAGAQISTAKLTTVTSGASATSYTAIYAGATTCTASITSSAPTTFCAGGSVLLTASSGVSYKWFNGTTQVGTAATYTATAAGSYTVEVTTATGCKATSNAIAITVNPLPVITQYAKIDAGAWTTTATAAVCQGGTVELGPQPNVAAGWRWTGPNNFTSVVRNTILTNSTSTQGGVYTATYTDANGCKATSSFTLQVASQPTATISSPATSFCAGGSVVLTAIAGSSYKWFNGTTQIGTTASYTASTAGAYTVEVTNAAGCKATSAVKQITSNALPTATITSPATSFCAGESVVLTASTGTSYKWFNGTTQIGTAASYTALTAGAYTVEVTNAAGCKATSAVTQISVTATVVWYQDSDNDEKGDPSSTLNACSKPTGYVATAGDACPADANKTAAGACGCGNLETDTDSDGTPNCLDSDDDNDGVADASDCAPLNAASGAQAIWYQDTDGDGLGDIVNTLTACTKPSGYVATAGDACPADANKTAAGNCGCGNTEASCLDCNGTPNGDAFLDNCSICVGGTTGNNACVTTATVNGTSINIQVIPQPFDATTTITVENYGPIQSYTIISASGSLVEIQQGLNETEITLGDTLASGLYTVIITTEKGTYTTKIVKK